MTCAAVSECVCDEVRESGSDAKHRGRSSRSSSVNLFWSVYCTVSERVYVLQETF